MYSCGTGHVLAKKEIMHIFVLVYVYTDFLCGVWSKLFEPVSELSLFLNSNFPVDLIQSQDTV